MRRRGGVGCCGGFILLFLIAVAWAVISHLWPVFLVLGALYIGGKYLHRWAFPKVQAYAKRANK